MLLQELSSTAVAELAPGLRRSLSEVLLNTSAARLDIMGRQVLMFETALRRHTGQSTLTVEQLSMQLRHDHPLFLDLMDRYPALASLAEELVDQQIAFGHDFARHLLSDWETLSTQFAGGAAIDGVTFSLERTETHGRGRSVVEVRLAGSPVFLYKPRDTSVEEAATRFLAQLASNDEWFSGWRLPRYSSRDGYGWVEWVTHEPCEAPSDVVSYYRRSGALVAVGVALGISDLHSANIIASGGSPVPIDLEAALQHRERPDSPARGSFRRARVLEWNALGTGLLPLWLWKGEDFHGVDLSGLGGVDEQWCSIPFANIEDRNEPSERVERGGVELYPTKNLVRDRDGITQRPWEFIDAIIAGYNRALDQLLSDQAGLRRVLAELSRVPVRYLAKPTAGYHYAIQASLHPTLMTDLARREAYLREVLQVDGPGPELLAAEVAACLIGDVPRFYGRPDALVVTEAAAPGRTIELPSAYYVAGAAAATADVFWLADPSRRQFDLDLIEGSMLALSSADGSLPQPDFSTGRKPFGPDTDTRPAIDSGLDFLRSFRARWADHREWYGFRSSPNGYYEFGLVGVDLYSGASGILDACRRLAPDSVTPGDFLAVIADCASSLDTDQPPKLGGAYFGLLSALAAAVAGLGTGPDREAARPHLQTIIDRIVQPATTAARSALFWGPDLLGGRAGALATVVVLSDSGLVDRAWYQQAATILVDDLLAESVAAPGQTVIWRRPGISASDDLALGGLSHGQAGISLALAMVAASPELPGDVRARAHDAALGAIRWEMDRLDEATGLFPDHRRASTAPEGELAWSHGTPGVALALDAIGDLLPDAITVEYRSRLDPFLAFRSHQERHGSAINPSLCHGALGTFLLLWRWSGHRDWADSADLRLVAASLRLEHWLEYEARPHRQRAIDAPGLMVGRAGTALGWRALAERDVAIVPLLPTDWTRSPVGRPSEPRSRA